MCIRDSNYTGRYQAVEKLGLEQAIVAVRMVQWNETLVHEDCLLYTSDAADERSSVDLGGRRIIKKKKKDQVAVSGHDHKIIRQDTILQVA